MQKYLLIALCAVLVLILTLLCIGQSVRAQGDPTPEMNSVLLTNLELVEARVRNFRQLESPILNRQVITPESLQQHIQADVLGRYTPDSARSDVLFYSAFGFMEPTDNLALTIENLILGQPITGFYDGQTDIMYVLPTESLGLFESILYARYYTLALEDYNFNTSALLSDELIATSPDQALALRALFEGDAHFVTQAYTEQLIESDYLIAIELMNRTLGGVNLSIDNAPNILRRELLFPSEDGYEFVERLYEDGGGWRLVNFAYEHPPLSTEHILHPTLYLLYEEPHVVTLRPIENFVTSHSEGKAWFLVRNQTLGEFYLREHLRLALPQDVADNVAAGWGGDRFELYGNNSDNTIFMLWKISWDSSPDAREFDSQYGSFLNQWLGVTGSVLENNIACWFNTTHNICKVAVGDTILIAAAPTVDLARELINYQLDGTKIFG